MTTPPLDLKCTAIATAWVADLGAPLPGSWDEPLSADYRPIGPVGRRGHDLLRMIEPEPVVLDLGAEPTRPWVATPSEADLVLHEPHRYGGGRGRFVLVADLLDRSGRAVIGVAEHRGLDWPAPGCGEHPTVTVRLRMGRGDDGVMMRHRRSQSFDGGDRRARMSQARGALEGIATATVVKPGDRVLVTVDAHWTAKQFAEAEQALADQFPDVSFTFLSQAQVTVVPPH